MNDAFISALLSAIIGALVSGIVAVLISTQQVRMTKYQLSEQKKQTDMLAEQVESQKLQTNAIIDQLKLQQQQTEEGQKQYRWGWVEPIMKLVSSIFAPSALSQLASDAVYRTQKQREFEELELFFAGMGLDILSEGNWDQLKRKVNIYFNLLSSNTPIDQLNEARQEGSEEFIRFQQWASVF
jgi:hypothetical protein